MPSRNPLALERIYDGWKRGEASALEALWLRERPPASGPQSDD